MHIRKRLLSTLTKLFFILLLTFTYLYASKRFELKYGNWTEPQGSYEQYTKAAFERRNADIEQSLTLISAGWGISAALYLLALGARQDWLKRWLKVIPDHQPEDDYMVTITEERIVVHHPKWQMGSVAWKDLHTILLVNTNEGPWLPDIWLTLIGDSGSCRIPHGSKGFEKVYAIVSMYKGFNFDNVSKSMRCTNNAEFILWTKR